MSERRLLCLSSVLLQGNVMIQCKHHTQSHANNGIEGQAMKMCVVLCATNTPRYLEDSHFFKFLNFATGHDPESHVYATNTDRVRKHAGNESRSTNVALNLQLTTRLLLSTYSPMKYHVSTRAVLIHRRVCYFRIYTSWRIRSCQ